MTNAVPAFRTKVRTSCTKLSQKILLFNNCVIIYFTPLTFLPKTPVTGSLLTSLFSTFLPKTPDMHRSAIPGTPKKTQSSLTTATKIFAVIYIN